MKKQNGTNSSVILSNLYDTFLADIKDNALVIFNICMWY